MNDKQFLTVKELSERIGVKPKTLYHWAEHGKIPAYKLNGVLLFDMNEIIALIKQGLIKPKNPFKRAKKMLGKNLSVGHNQPDSGQEMSRDKRSSYV